MSTNARIGIQAHADAEVESIYSHWDGYPTGVGKKLQESWRTEEAVRSLIELGDLSNLGTVLGEKHDFDTHMGVYGTDDYMGPGSPYGKGWCLFYDRDRGESDVGSKTHPKDAWPNYGQEWEYLFVVTLGEWLCRSVGWGSTPHGEWEPLSDSIRKDQAEQDAYLATLNK